MRIEVTFEMEIEENTIIHHSEIDEWLRFELGNTGNMRIINPLYDTDIEAKSVLFKVI